MSEPQCITCEHQERSECNYFTNWNEPLSHRYTSCMGAGSPQWCPLRNQDRKFDGADDEFTIPNPYHLLANEVADLVVEKQVAYGDSFGKAGEVMRILYPDGIKPDQLDDALVVVRVIDKLFRIATDRDALGEDPWRDVMGYSLLSVGRKS